LHLAAFGCEQCKAIVRQEIEKERERCAKIAEDEPRVWEINAPDPQTRIAKKIRESLQ
jgi:hypothetical protein